jgi:adenosylhomocysteine nucleosidase
LILIFYAFAREVSPLKRRLTDRRPIGHGKLRGLRGRLAGRELAMVATGIGHVRALEAARAALDHFPDAALVLATGVAGALSEDLQPGDLVLVERIVADDLGEAMPREIAIASAHLDSIAAALQGKGLRHARGAMLTARRVLPGAREKIAARDATGAIAVDMETAAIAAEAARRGISFAGLRAILDAVGDEIFGPKIGERGEIRPLATAGRLMRNPAALFKIPRMMKNLSLATNALADALEEIVARESATRPPQR